MFADITEKLLLPDIQVQAQVKGEALRVLGKVLVVEVSRCVQGCSPFLLTVSQ
jgi:hypothetical protein